MNNEAIDYTLIRNDKQKIVLNKNCHHWSVRKKRLSLYEFSLWGGDFVSIVRIIEGPYYRGYFYKECMGTLPGPSKLSVLEVSILKRCL